MAWLADLGYTGLGSSHDALRSEPTRPVEHGISAFLTDNALAWLDRQDGAWFTHLSYLRPHPPYAAAGHFATMYDPADVPAPIEAQPQHRFHDRAIRVSGAPHDETAMRHKLQQIKPRAERVG